MHKKIHQADRTRDPMISKRTPSPLDYQTVAGPGPDPDPDPNPRGGGQLPNPKSAILTSATRGETLTLTLIMQFYANEWN